MNELFGQLWPFTVGIIAYMARKKIGDKLLDMMRKSERRTTIWNHYMNWGKGDDRHASDVTECSVDKCATI